ncbi:3-methyladenine DNA glycosylase [bacterium]|jgi:DNA-3-methyladenine glycosylase|nr:3-methyladenine DNA glycosylase [bacterium]|tara:strand:- start:22874 stop:23428 length:555 start_codon:yes stop_codon:yes gene_type:complete
MRKILEQSFFEKSAPDVAQSLIGKYLVRKIGDREIAAIITETEAYDGPHDKASHASKGRTVRTEIMFGPAGHLYVYLCYGMHHMLNIATDSVGYPAAVLIRGIALQGSALKHIKSLDGPGKLTKYLQINKTLNALHVSPQTGLWFEDRGIEISKRKIMRTPRIGVAYAGVLWSKKKYRFVLKNY